jgi:hypothetical protein
MTNEMKYENADMFDVDSRGFIDQDDLRKIASGRIRRDS